MNDQEDFGNKEEGKLSNSREVNDVAMAILHK
jgi:hypothetical protein